MLYLYGGLEVIWMFFIFILRVRLTILHAPVTISLARLTITHVRLNVSRAGKIVSKMKWHSGAND